MLAHARELDSNDPLQAFRREFSIPQQDGRTDLYFVGNSLGLMPRRTSQVIQQELATWGSLGVRGHFEGPHPWFSYHEPIAPLMAPLVGAKESEVVLMNSLTVNLHLMLATFYRPNSKRFKILIEDHAFPSDHYAVESQLRLAGHDPQTSLIRCRPDAAGLFLTAAICQTIEDHADSLALILLPGVQYYSGEVFDIPTITKLAARYGIPIGFDLAHAAGNVPLALHDWQVDFAVWCTYKYLNSGPGAVAGCFVHERHATNTDLDRLAGWWGHDKQTRFQMGDQFHPIASAEGWQLSNPPILALAPVRASLEIFEQAGGMQPLREKSKQMQTFFRTCLQAELGDHIKVIAPAERSGCQLSLQIMADPGFGNASQLRDQRVSADLGRAVYQQLEETGIRVDWREPNVIRAAPTPLYNTFEEIWSFVDRLKTLLTSLNDPNGSNRREDHSSHL